MNSFFPPPQPILQNQVAYFPQQSNLYPNQAGMILQPGMNQQMMQPNVAQQVQAGPQPPIVHQIIPQTPQQIPQGQIPANPFQSVASGISNPPAIVQQSPYPPPPVVVSHPAPTKERYAWAQRTEKMKWGIAESIDIEQIVRRGDLASVLFYMDQFINATITKEDLKQFGSKGALNAFLILQLGADYLMAQKNRLEMELENQKPNNEQANASLVAEYNKNMEIAVKHIQKRDERIAELRKREVDLLQEREKHKKLLQKYHKKFLSLKSKRSGKRNKTQKKPNKTIESDQEEPGEVTDNTAYQILKENKSTFNQSTPPLIQSSIANGSENGEIKIDSNRLTLPEISSDDNDFEHSDGEITDSNEYYESDNPYPDNENNASSFSYGEDQDEDEY